MLLLALLLGAAAGGRRLFRLWLTAAIQSKCVPQKEESADRDGNDSFHQRLHPRSQDYTTILRKSADLSLTPF